jgi:tetratricopeptide (TPR) repeat protein
VIARIANESGGNPLFAEELAMAHRANVAQGQPASSLPSRLSDVLTAKLDRVGRHRALVHTAATIGFEVPQWLLQAASGVSESELEAGLQAVVEADVLRVDRRRAYRSYVFRHELLRRVAYAQQTVASRVEHHGRIADALSDEGPPWGEPEVMAYHLSAAERYDSAASAWIGAAERSTAIGAYREAIQHYDRVLGVFTSPPVVPTPDNQSTSPVTDSALDRLSPQVRFGVDLQASLGRGSAFAATQGWRYAGTEADFAHALDLCRAAGTVPALLPALVGLWLTTLLRCDFVSGDALIAMAMETVADQAESESDLLAEVEACAAYQDFFTGRLASARSHFATASQLFRAREASDESGPPTSLRRWALPQEPWCTSLIMHALTELLLGNASESESRAAEAQLRAEALVNAQEAAGVYHYSAAIVSIYEAWRRALRGDPESSAVAAHETVALAEPHGHLELLLPANLHAGIAAVRMGSAAETRAGMEAGVAMWRASGARLLLPHFLVGLAEARLMTADPEGALEAIQEAVELTRENDIVDIVVGRQRDLLLWPEVLRARARIRVTIDSGAIAYARDDLRGAIEAANSMSARLFELSAACDWVELEPASTEAHAALVRATDALSAGDDSPLATRARSLVWESVRAGSE